MMNLNPPPPPPHHHHHHHHALFSRHHDIFECCCFVFEQVTSLPSRSGVPGSAACATRGRAVISAASHGRRPAVEQTVVRRPVPHDVEMFPQPRLAKHGRGVTAHQERLVLLYPVMIVKTVRVRVSRDCTLVPGTTFLTPQSLVVLFIIQHSFSVPPIYTS